MKEWSIMFFLNAKNPDEEPEAFKIFSKIAAVGSRDKINFLVEFGRGDHANVKFYGGWSTTLRFCVEQGMEPIRDRAKEDLGKIDMGKGSSIENFVSWGLTEYPAHHNMLVIVDHGQGWAITGGPISLKSNTVSSLDPDTGHQVYNRDLQNRLLKILGGESLDIIGFDACCMAMIETAYAMREVGKVMVASEDIEFPLWSSGSWLEDLATNPQMDAKQLGIAIVGSYQALCTKCPGTLSAVDLSTVNELANGITDFVSACIPKLGPEANIIKAARGKCLNYGAAGNLHGVDCFRWFYLYSKTASISPLREKAGAVCDQISRSVFANFATADRGKSTDYGSYGLAIYYPASAKDYKNDPYGPRYLRSNTDYPVEFVQANEWVRFLQSLGIVKEES